MSRIALSVIKSYVNLYSERFVPDDEKFVAVVLPSKELRYLYFFIGCVFSANFNFNHALTTNNSMYIDFGFEISCLQMYGRLSPFLFNKISKWMIKSSQT